MSLINFLSGSGENMANTIIKSKIEFWDKGGLMDELGSGELGEGVSYQSLLHVSSNQNWYSRLKES